MASISYQLYSSRNWDADETFGMLAGLGFSEVEGFGPFVDDPARTRALLDAHGLAMPTAHFALDLVARDPDTVIGTAKALGVQAVVAPFIPPEQRPITLDDWQAFAADLATSAAPILSAGLEFAWHNHDFELVPVDGVIPLDVIASASSDIKLELDLAWVTVAGQDPVEWLNRYAGRIVAAHVKDVAPAGENEDEGGWADVGHGIMDWPAIKAAMDAAGVQRYVIEHDNPSDHRRMATRSLATVQAL